MAGAESEGSPMNVFESMETIDEIEEIIKEKIRYIPRHNLP